MPLFIQALYGVILGVGFLQGKDILREQLDLNALFKLLFLSSACLSLHMIGISIIQFRLNGRKNSGTTVYRSVPCFSSLKWLL